jgi:hypothetical protein
VSGSKWDIGTGQLDQIGMGHRDRSIGDIGTGQLDQIGIMANSANFDQFFKKYGDGWINCVIVEVWG